MEIYTLNEVFQRVDLIEEFNSLIWTERYSDSGEVQLVVPATDASVSQIREGSFLGLEGSREVMMIETQMIEDGLVTVTGRTLLDFLKNRIVRASNSATERSWFIPETTPGSAMAQIVEQMCTSAGTAILDGLGFVGAREVIPNLDIGDIEETGEIVGNREIAYGTVYDALKLLADSYSLGMSLYLDHADLDGYALKFTNWAGKDRTNSNTDSNDVVIFSPVMDTLADVEELRSIQGYKNVCYAFNPVEDHLLLTDIFGVAYADPASALAVGFKRRTLMIFVEDFKSTDFESIEITVADMLSVLNERARNALANNNYTKVVDGEVIPQSEYQYGTHYNLGDIIDLKGITGTYQPARITEYIRAKDQDGERSYPTVSVLV